MVHVSPGVRHQPRPAPPVQARCQDAEPDQAHTRFIVCDDPEEVAERIGRYVELGFSELLLHAPGADQGRFLSSFAAAVLPRLRELRVPQAARA